MKQNCWEWRQCGFGPGGERVQERGVCPAAAEERLNGIHGGLNGGRACWVVGGTFCDGTPHGTFAQKSQCCQTCGFHETVQQEELHEFHLAPALLAILGTTAL